MSRHAEFRQIGVREIRSIRPPTAGNRATGGCRSAPTQLPWIGIGRAALGAGRGVCELLARLQLGTKGGTEIHFDGKLPTVEEDQGRVERPHSDWHHLGQRERTEGLVEDGAYSRVEIVRKHHQ
jgi:hypothetical protein